MASPIEVIYHFDACSSFAPCTPVHLMVWKRINKITIKKDSEGKWTYREIIHLCLSNVTRIPAIYRFKSKRVGELVFLFKSTRRNGWLPWRPRVLALLVTCRKTPDVPVLWAGHQWRRTGDSSPCSGAPRSSPSVCCGGEHVLFDNGGHQCFR